MHPLLLQVNKKLNAKQKLGFHTIYLMVLSLHSIIKLEMAVVVHEEEVDNLGKNPAIKIAGTNLSASGWAILQVCILGL